MACNGPAPGSTPRADAAGTTATASGDADAAARDAAALAAIRRAGNHLRDEPSPYLQQHAHNPIDWYPWGPEALAKAKAENKPIFVSVGYASCHWCHVMAHESFEDDAIATLLNRHFVAIKVDREQRPDIDALCLAAVATRGGETGWPLNVFFTPQLAPIAGATYLPPRAQGDRGGLFELAQRVQAEFARSGEAAAGNGLAVLEAWNRDAGSPRGGFDVAATLDALARERDEVRGGFGSRQKFPHAPLLSAQLRAAVTLRDDAARADAAREHLETTLARMEDGGLRDHVGGGFHRYTVDPDWHLPHFETTLYDNAQLALVYLEAGRRFEQPRWTAVARGVLDGLLARWRLDGGGFAVGFDADDAEGEGRYYAWSRAELTAALAREDADAVAAVFDVGDEGEPELGGRQVLHRVPRASLVARLGEDAAAAAIARAEAALPTLARARAQRPAPARDDKLVVAWNALAIAAMAEAGRVLDEPRYLAAATEAAQRLEQCCRDGDRVTRGVVGSRPLGEGFVDDHALLGLALLRLFAATGDRAWLQRAHELARALRRDFWDDARGGLRHRAHAGELPLATLDLDDGPTPSGTSATAALWLELGTLVGDDALRDDALALLDRWGLRAQQTPAAAGTLLATAIVAPRLREVVIAGPADEPRTRALLEVLREPLGTRFVLAIVPAEGIDATAAAQWPSLAHKTATAGVPTAYVCEHGSCRAPARDPATLRAQLDVRG
ncbi:MAG: thioredoxin domain-containing protein [Nannocystaceae bacterium]|nr:thioredoxin domain-containing protein [Nannocystaceae bacterium]